jgi:stearoyl-CoA desaturase (delta-9 desaturase)
MTSFEFATAVMSRATRPFGSQKGEPPWLLSLRVFERHVGVLVALLLVPLNWPLAVLFVSSYCARVFALDGAYHRYFGHRAYRAGRAMQFLLALWGTQSGQRGPLWWAAKHREHHRYADTSRDPHSPHLKAFWYAHLGWFVDARNADTDLDAVPELARYPELRWLNKYYLVPFYGSAVLLGVAGYYGWLGPQISVVSAVLWGFYVPSFLQIHAIATINTLGHMPKVRGGYRRFETPDQSVNRPVLALLTLGAGWHNNHHRCATLARAGFAWYEIDAVYYLLRGLQVVRAIRDVKSAIPEEIRREGRLPAARAPRAVQ